MRYTQTVVGDERMHGGGDAVVGVGGESNSRIPACSVLSTLLVDLFATSQMLGGGKLAELLNIYAIEF